MKLFLLLVLVLSTTSCIGPKYESVDLVKFTEARATEKAYNLAMREGVGVDALDVSPMMKLGKESSLAKRPRWGGLIPVVARSFESQRTAVTAGATSEESNWIKKFLELLENGGTLDVALLTRAGSTSAFAGTTLLDYQINKSPFRAQLLYGATTEDDEGVFGGGSAAALGLQWSLTDAIHVSGGLSAFEDASDDWQQGGYVALNLTVPSGG